MSQVKSNQLSQVSQSVERDSECESAQANISEKIPLNLASLEDSFMYPVCSVVATAPTLLLGRKPEGFILTVTILNVAITPIANGMRAHLYFVSLKN